MRHNPSHDVRTAPNGKRYVDMGEVIKDELDRIERKKSMSEPITETNYDINTLPELIALGCTDVLMSNEGDGWELEICISREMYEQGWRAAIGQGKTPQEAIKNGIEWFYKQKVQ